MLGMCYDNYWHNSAKVEQMFRSSVRIFGLMMPSVVLVLKHGFVLAKDRRIGNEKILSLNF
jgi:hypothetical protein